MGGDRLGRNLKGVHQLDERDQVDPSGPSLDLGDVCLLLAKSAELRGKGERVPLAGGSGGKVGRRNAVDNASAFR